MFLRYIFDKILNLYISKFLQSYCFSELSQRFGFRDVYLAFFSVFLSLYELLMPATSVRSSGEDLEPQLASCKQPLLISYWNCVTSNQLNSHIMYKFLLLPTWMQFNFCNNFNTYLISTILGYFSKLLLFLYYILAFFQQSYVSKIVRF